MDTTDPSKQSSTDFYCDACNVTVKHKKPHLESDKHAANLKK